jgi:hypothetical protein
MGFKNFMRKQGIKIKSELAEQAKLREEVRAAAKVERKKQAIATAIAKEKHRGKVARSVIGKSSGSGLDFSSGMNNIFGTPSKNKPPRIF